MLVVIDPYPTFSAVLSDRSRTAIYLLPAATQFETRGSVTASNRSLQWRDKIVDPVFESLPDHVIMAKFANKFGWADRFFRNIEMEDAETPSVESITREFNRGMWTVGYTGQSPERIKLHMANQHTFDRTTLQAIGGTGRRGLLRNALAELGDRRDGPSGHAKSLRHVKAGGRRRPYLPRPISAWRRDGENLLAEGVYSVGSEIQDGYPEFTMQMLMDLGWDSDLTDAERAAIDAVAGPKTNWKTDLSGGIQRVAIKSWLRAFRQRQGPGRGVELPGSGAVAPRAALRSRSPAGR